eukprot:GFUD01009452.1.p1 GENE.GFUD01009452.1~~GFUD01009452.1.p1  ORF type:complete len:267 (+),score=87.05 GFUD01009452.1:69-869(+)
MSLDWTGFESGFSSLDTGGTRMASGAMAEKSGNWEGLRKQARALENEIDLKLVTFSKLGTNYSRAQTVESDKQPLLGGADSSLDSIQSEIDSLLANLGQVNEEMAGYAAGAGEGRSAAIHHTLQRHSEILQDYNQEFKKTSSNIASIVEREDLLSSVQSDMDDYRNKEGTKKNQKIDTLQRELEHTRNSERLIDEQINIALDTRDSLVNQREVLKAVQTKLNDLTNKFPLINNLVNKINFRKRRDTIILGVVIGLCLVFMIWYAFG